MKKITVYLIEDSISYWIEFRNEFEKFIEKHNLFFKYKLVYIQNYIEYYDNLEIYDIKDNDIFIVDIYLNTYFTGIDFSKKLRNKNSNTTIIFLTSLENKAIEVINNSIQPKAYFIKSPNIEITRNNIFDLFHSIELDYLQRGNLLVTTTDHINLVLNYSDILFISVKKGTRNKLILQTIDSDIVIQGSMSKLKKELGNSNFYIDFKSIIINMNNIKGLSLSEGKIIFINEYELFLNSRFLSKLINSYNEDKR